MAEEQRGDEIQDILSDLDNILSDISTPVSDAAVADALNAAAPPAVGIPKPEAAAPPALKAPMPAPKPAAAQVPAAPPPRPAPVIKAAPAAPAPAVSLAPPPAPAPARPAQPAPAMSLTPPPTLKPAPAAPPAAAKPPAPAPAAAPPAGLSIELGTRPAVAPAAKKPEPANPAPAKPGLASRPPLEIKAETPGGPSNPTPTAAPPKAVPASPAAPAPAAAPPLPGGDDIPDKTPKEQIRRVAFLYTAEHAAKKDVLAKFMASSAQTISKKPLYLRRVLFEEVGANSDGKGILGRVESLKAVAVLGILEGLPESKTRELTEVFSGAGILFRAVGPDEVQKRSIAVDIIVDMMLLNAES
ncbi:MAG: hypothetical protein HY077_15925 [Elusimicrobia bacterium]|nr:hypothetical protein [Elusimicrobiota bacterium]